MHQALEFGPIGAAGFCGVGAQHHVPVHTGGVGFVPQRFEQQAIEAQPLECGIRFGIRTKAPQQFSLGMARLARLNCQNQQSARLDGALQSLFGALRAGNERIAGCACLHAR